MGFMVLMVAVVLVLVIEVVLAVAVVLVLVIEMVLTVVVVIVDVVVVLVVVVTAYVRLDNQLGDILTKPLAHVPFRDLSSKLGMFDMYAPA